MDGTDFTAPFHGRRAGVDMVELEVRQDLLADAVGVARMAQLLGPLLARLDAPAT
jgi:predicted N-formylglutamate amidohydrolase